MKFKIILLLSSLLLSFSNLPASNSGFGSIEYKSGYHHGTLIKRSCIFKNKGQYAADEDDEKYRKSQCTTARKQQVVSSVLLGIGVGSLAGGITLLAKGATTFNEKKNYWMMGGGGVMILAGVIVPTISIIGIIENKKRIKKFCGKQSVQISPGLNGVSFAYRF